MICTDMFSVTQKIQTRINTEGICINLI